MASIEFLEEILDCVEKIPAKEEPALPVKPGVGIDLTAISKLDAPSATPSKKNWNRGTMVNSSSKNATSPSEASTQIPFSPAAETSVMSVSPCNINFDEESEGTLEALQALAEKYAQIKKTFSGDEMTSALQTAAETLAVALGKEKPEFPDAETKVADIEKFLQETVRPYVPVVDFEETSIGSLLHVRKGAAGCAGLCRFHVKGKCFDGILCRFCHMNRDEHVREGGGRKNESPTRDRLHQDRRWDYRAFAPTPPKHAPLAHPLLCLPTPMPMPMAFPQITPPARSAKPASREQEGLCELLSSIKVQTPEETRAQQMQQMQMQQMQQFHFQQMQQMQHYHQLQQMSHMYSPEQYWDAAWDSNPVPVVPPVSQIHARRGNRTRRS